MDHSSEGRIVVAVQRTLDNSYSLACRQGEPGGSGLGDLAALTVLEATACLIRVLRAECGRTARFSPLSKVLVYH
jgi:hypothetical protein